MSDKSVHGPKKSLHMVCIHPKTVCIKCACIFCPSLFLMFLSTEQVWVNVYDMDIAPKHCLPKTSLKKNSIICIKSSQCMQQVCKKCVYADLMHTFSENHFRSAESLHIKSARSVHLQTFCRLFNLQPRVYIKSACRSAPSVHIQT